MTENKLPPQSAAAAAASFYKPGQTAPSAASVSHSINEILSRPPQLGQLPRLTASMYLNNHAAAAAAAVRLTKPLTDLPGRTPVYWPSPSPWQQRDQTTHQPYGISGNACSGSPGELHLIKMFCVIKSLINDVKSPKRIIYIYV